MLLNTWEPRKLKYKLCAIPEESIKLYGEGWVIAERYEVDGESIYKRYADFNLDFVIHFTYPVLNLTNCDSIDRGIQILEELKQVGIRLDLTALRFYNNQYSKIWKIVRDITENLKSGTSLSSSLIEDIEQYRELIKDIDPIKEEKEVEI
jgi:hypothetical protein